MSFANRIAYTQSPGGIRLGLIWQSSNMLPVERDWRFHYFTPFKPGGVTSNIYLPDNTIQLPNGTMPDPNNNVNGLIGFKIPINGDIQPFTCPLFPYTTTTDVDPDGNTYVKSYAAEQSYYNDLDFYISPAMRTVGSSNSQPTGTTDSNNNYIVSGNRYELRNGPHPYAYGYINHNPGECYDTLNTSEYRYKMLKNERNSYPTCPMRIKMRVVYSDYPFSLSPGFTGGWEAANAINIPYENWQAYFTNILDSYSVLPYGFGGSTIYSEEDGRYYNDFNPPTFQVKNAYRKEEGGEAIPGPTQRDQRNWYRYTDGVVYDGVNRIFQMHMSPILYPAISVSGTTSSFSDYAYFLPDRYDPDTETVMGNFGFHASPFLLPPSVKSPYIDILFHSANNVVTPRYVENEFKFTTTDQSYVDPDVEFDPYVNFNGDSVIGRSTLAPRGISMDGNTTHDYSSIVWNNIFGARSRWDQLYSYIQPRVQQGQLYVQEFRTVLCKYDRYIKHTDLPGAYCGRFKYVGIKGAISFFEN